jgi:hypothetical protein
MAKPARGGLIAQIERGATDSRADLAGLLRKCIALGGQAGSEELRDWARRELDGYGGSNELPPYRRISAPLLIDGFQGRWQLRRKQISVWELPDVAQQAFGDDFPITFGVAELERLATAHEAIDLQPPGMADLAYIMNRSPEYNVQIERLYYSVAPVAFHGVVDAIRTKLVALIAEIRAAGVPDNGVPSAAIANQAVQVIIKGRARATISTAVGDGAVATSTTNDTIAKPTSRVPAWIRGPWGVTVGGVTLAAGVATIGAWLNWTPFW